MRLLRMTCMLIVAAALGMSCATVHAEQLLSRNATYRVYGAGYCYSGMVQPGVNLRPKKGTFIFTPLVEQTDTGDLLIDGNTDGKSMVYTPWFWNAHWKTIIVEMNLPGPSKVTLLANSGVGIIPSGCPSGVTAQTPPPPVLHQVQRTGR